jgi:hypothetical protein
MVSLANPTPHTRRILTWPCLVTVQYLRLKYQVPSHLVVAAGDSGNDVLMLEGGHPAIVVGNAQVRAARCVGVLQCIWVRCCKSGRPFSCVECTIGS